MTRKELYDFIKENNLKETIKDVFGKNFTNVSTDQLLYFVNSLPDPIEEKEPKDSQQNSCVYIKKYEENFLRLIQVLKTKGFLLKSELEFILG